MYHRFSLSILLAVCLLALGCKFYEGRDLSLFWSLLSPDHLRVRPAHSTCLINIGRLNEEISKVLSPTNCTWEDSQVKTLEL